MGEKREPWLGWLNLWTTGEGEESLLAEYRDQIAVGLATAGATFLLPFALNNLVQGRYILGLGTFLIVLGLAANALCLRLRRRAPVPTEWLFAPVVATLAFAVRAQGVIGVFWCFPSIIFFHFVLRRQLANRLSLGLMVLVAPMADTYLGGPVAVRAIVTLFLTTLFANIFVAIISNLQRQLREQAVIDPLTGAYNRRQLDLSLARSVDRLRRHGSPVALVALDLDHFKRINDELGHAAGDSALKSTVAVLVARLRKIDDVFRTGGEEFLVLLSDTGLADACLVAESLRQCVAAADLVREHSGERRAVTVSLGVAALAPGEDPDAWLSRADRLLYEAKRRGRNCVVSA